MKISMMKWAMAAALVCGPMMFTGCNSLPDNVIVKDGKNQPVNAERAAFQQQLSQQLALMAQNAKFESALESTQALTEFMNTIDTEAMKLNIGSILQATLAQASLKPIEFTTLEDKDRKAFATCLKDRFNMTDEAIAALPAFVQVDAAQVLNKVRMTFKNGGFSFTHVEEEGLCIESVKADGTSTKAVLTFNDVEKGISFLAANLGGSMPVALSLPESIGVTLTTANGKVLNGTVTLSYDAPSRYLSFASNKWSANVVLKAVAGGRNETLTLTGDHAENGVFDGKVAVSVAGQELIAMSVKGQKEKYTDEYLKSDEVNQLATMGPIFNAFRHILKLVNDKSVEELSVTFGGDLQFIGSCSDVAKTLIALGNLYKLWGTNPDFQTVDAYTQELNKYVPFTVKQVSTGIVAQGKLVTVMKGINHEEYQPAVALTFKGETEAKTMLESMSKEDRENYNALIGSVNNLIQQCDKLLGVAIVKARDLISIVKL